MSDAERLERRREYARQWRAANREKVREASRKWREAHPEEAKAASAAWSKRNAAKVAERRKVYREANADRLKANFAAWYESVKDDPEYRNRKSQAAMQWARENPDRFKAIQATRRARERSSGDGITTAEWISKLAEWGHACAYCGATGVSLEIEHMVPLSRGGTSSPENIVPACGPCNRRKASKTAAEFAGWQP